MARGMSLQTRREVLAQMIPQYHQALSAQKRQLLDEFTRFTGYYRKYAMSLLKCSAGQGIQPSAQPCLRMYDSEAEEALVLICNKANSPCSKRLVPFLPPFSRC